MAQAYPPEQSYMLWCLSWAGLCVGLFGLLRGYLLLGFLHTLSGLTALSYWRDPEMTSWRRLVDILAVQLTLWATLARVRSLPCRGLVSIWVVLGALSYGAGWLLVAYPWPSAIAHAVLHIFANLVGLTVYVVD